MKQLVETASAPSAARASGISKREVSQLSPQVKRFYEQTGYRLIWVDGDRPSRRYQELVRAIEAAPRHGLNPGLYDVTNAPGLPARASNKPQLIIPSDRAPEFDWWVTFLLFRYATDLSAGRLDPQEFERQWTLRPQRSDLTNVLVEAVSRGDLPGAINRVAPTHPEYIALQQVLERYRAIQAKGGWSSVPDVRQLKPGESSAVVPALRRRLAMTGELDVSLEQDQSPIFDAALVDAVRRFEDRHRLKPDGIVDAAVVAAMNVPVEQRIQQLELSMERWRWLPDKMPDRYIRVNIPDYRLEVVEHAQPVMDVRVVVGKPSQPTPIFADDMTHLVFSPSWHIPSSIARNETIPQAAADPGFLARNNIEVVRGSGDSVEVLDPASIDWTAAEGGNLSFRQRPGRGNSLGLVKFMFPNNFNVYLHDTPADHLFHKVERGFSHGCVRVEEPLALAEYVLRDRPEWTRDKIMAAMHAGRERQVSLKSPIPVFILYLTAWADPHGTVRFLDDIYGHDGDQMGRVRES